MRTPGPRSRSLSRSLPRMTSVMTRTDVYKLPSISGIAVAIALLNIYINSLAVVN